MKLLNLTLDTPAANVALDEALLETAQEQNDQAGILRLWESSRPMVVLGRSSRIAEEVHLEHCRAEGIDVIRRTSGGATIMTGPGCLTYALILNYETYPAARMIDEAHRAVLDPLERAFGRLDSRTRRIGISDLALDQQKFSGNALRCRRTHFLYHGTILYDFPLYTIGQALAQAPRQPKYRENREHLDFVGNFPASAEVIKQTLIDAWSIKGELSEWPEALCAELVEEKYSREEWNYSR